MKAVEAESHYRTCVEESNARHRNLLAVKSQVRKQLWLLIMESHLFVAGPSADQGAVDAG